MHTPKRKHSTETGTVSRYEPGVPLPAEPVQPPTLPEMDDPQATTGAIQVISEGIDESEDADDSLIARRR